MKICDECETVAHCTKHGCIPKVSSKDSAMRLALEALESERDIYRENAVEDGAPEYIYEAITALRSALAEQPAQQEPVYFCDYGYEGWGKVDAAMAAENLACGMTVEAYYTSPPAQRKPLTGDEVRQILDKCDDGQESAEFILAFARAIEAAHGIKENT